MKGVIAVAAFQVAVMLGWAAHNEHVRRTAPTFRIPLQPRDPYDVLRGRYFIMNPKDRWIRTGEAGVMLMPETLDALVGKERTFYGPAQVGFCPEGEVFRVCAVAPLGKEPAGPARYWSRARLSVWWESGAPQTEPPRPLDPPPGYRVEIDLALDRFFLPNRVELPGRETEAGWEVEVAHRPGLTPLPVRLFFKGRPLDVS